MPRMLKLPIMDKLVKARILSLLAERAGSESGRTIVLKIAEGLDDSKASMIITECEEMVRYRNWLSEREAIDIVTGFVNLDNSKGPHWKDAGAMFDAVETLGISPDCLSKWNRWAWYATINMVWSDEWGVLSAHIDQSEELRVCAELTKARLNDPDGGFNVRRYFGLDL